MSQKESHPVPEPQFPGSGLARVAIGLLGLGMVADVAGVGSSVLQVRLLERMKRGEVVPPDVAAANDLREQLLGIGQLAIFVLTAVFFLAWLHKAYKNLAVLGSPSSAFSPGAAVGAWFIPFVNLVRPYQVVTELWRKSDPEGQADFGTSPPASLKLWWGTWMATNFLGWFLLRSTMSPFASVPELIHASWMQAANSAIGIVPATLAILVIRTISRRQAERHRRLLERPDGIDPLASELFA